MVRFASFLSGGFITVIVVNPPESKPWENAPLWTCVHLASKWLKYLLQCVYTKKFTY